MCSDRCEEPPSSSPALQAAAPQHAVQYTSNSGFLQHAACMSRTLGTTLAGLRAVLYPCPGELVVAWDPLLQQF